MTKYACAYFVTKLSYAASIGKSLKKRHEMVRFRCFLIPILLAFLFLNFLPDSNTETINNTKILNNTRAPKSGPSISTMVRPTTEPDPCKQPNNPCDPLTEICWRSQSSYECRCKPGFKRMSESGDCEVFNPCGEKNNCSEHAQCINEIESHSYKCICKSGYVGDGVDCVDKNECDANETNECHKFATCINQDGGYKCICKTGFEEHKGGRVCLKKNKTAIETYALIGLITGIPILTFVVLTIYVCKRRVRRRALTREAEYSPENPTNDDIIPPDNQRLINTAESFYEENIPMKGLPASESAWSEWPDYDDTRESDSD